ncbi:MAG TPA: RNA polymerase sigma factor [Magnetospirillum sp.]|nr:RNA polymerase sigma factor [Magnetospirillum sp.]
MSEPLGSSLIDESDFVTLVQEQQGRLYHFILRNIGNPSDAEELAQQTFVEAYRAMATFRGQSELSTWLLGIAMNLVRNYLARSPHRRNQFVSDETLETTASEDQSPAERLQYSQAFRALSAELEILPNELREVLMLVAVDGISYDQAAGLLAVPVGTVRSRLSRARSTLRERLPHIVEIFDDL